MLFIISSSFFKKSYVVFDARIYVHIPIYFYAKLLKKIELFDVQIYFLHKIL